MNDPIAPDRIGRFSRAELEAMRGKRGRKPAEYFELYPDLKREPTPRAANQAGESTSASAVVACAEPRLAYEADPLAARLAQASPEARRLVSDLLDLLAMPQSRPVARPVAHAIPCPVSSVVGDLAISLPASDAAVEESPVAPAPVQSEQERGETRYRDPVYADPETDGVHVVEDEAVGVAG